MRTPNAVNELDEEEIPISFLVALLGSLAIVRHLVEYSYACINTVNRQNRDILHYAAFSGNVEFCRYLVECVGIEVTRGDKKLLTAFKIAHELE